MILIQKAYNYLVIFWWKSKINWLLLWKIIYVQNSWKLIFDKYYFKVLFEGIIQKYYLYLKRANSFYFDRTCFSKTYLVIPLYFILNFCFINTSIWWLYYVRIIKHNKLKMDRALQGLNYFKIWKIIEEFLVAKK